MNDSKQGEQTFPKRNGLLQTSLRRMGIAAVAHRNERVQLEMKIMKYRQVARQASSDDVNRQRIEELISELEEAARD